MLKQIKLLLTLFAAISCCPVILCTEEAKHQPEPFENILQIYEEELKENPHNLELLKALGKAYYHLEKYRNAAVLLKKLLN